MWGLAQSCGLTKSPCALWYILLGVSSSLMDLTVKSHQGHLISPTELLTITLLPRNLAPMKQQLYEDEAEARPDPHAWASSHPPFYLSVLPHPCGSLYTDHADPTSNAQVLNSFEVCCSVQADSLCRLDCVHSTLSSTRHL